MHYDLVNLVRLHRKELLIVTLLFIFVLLMLLLFFIFLTKRLEMANSASPMSGAAATGLNRHLETSLWHLGMEGKCSKPSREAILFLVHGNDWMI